MQNRSNTLFTSEFKKLKFLSLIIALLCIVLLPLNAYEEALQKSLTATMQAHRNLSIMPSLISQLNKVTTDIQSLLPANIFVMTPEQNQWYNFEKAKATLQHAELSFVDLKNKNELSELEIQLSMKLEKSSDYIEMLRAIQYFEQMAFPFFLFSELKIAKVDKNYTCTLKGTLITVDIKKYYTTGL